MERPNLMVTGWDIPSSRYEPHLRIRYPPEWISHCELFESPGNGKIIGSFRWCHWNCAQHLTTNALDMPIRSSFFRGTQFWAFIQDSQFHSFCVSGLDRQRPNFISKSGSVENRNFRPPREWEFDAGAKADNWDIQHFQVSSGKIGTIVTNGLLLSIQSCNDSESWKFVPSFGPSEFKSRPREHCHANRKDFVHW
jgi:hypothetical protein